MGSLPQVENYISQHSRGARTTLTESLSAIHLSLRFLPPSGKLRICGIAVFGRSCALKAAKAALFQSPAGVSRRPCGEVRKGPVSPMPACALEDGALACPREPEARVPRPPAQPSPALETPLPGLAAEGKDCLSLLRASLGRQPSF